jgi:hypothetical protein
VYWLARGEERGEDFPVSSWPLVVKCDADLSRPQIIEMLRWLAARLEHDADADEALLVRWP